MQDYIEIIDQEGLLTNQQNDAILPEPEKSESSKTNEQTQQQVPVKKAALAKLPEENQDAWKMLEQAMNQSSIKKEQPNAPSIEMPVGVQQMQKSASINVGFSQPPVASVFTDFNSLDDEDNFPVPKKQQFRPFGAQLKNDNDYVQQMIQANASNNLAFSTPNQNDGLKALVKSERKNRKKGKKSVKVQEFNDANLEEDKEDSVLHVAEETSQ